MDQQRIKEAKREALDLLPKLKAAAAKEGNDNRFTITWRYNAARENAIEYAKPALTTIYGRAYEYELITSGDPDGLGDLQMAGELAVRAQFFLSNVIKHLEAQS